jgi:hypothetical protein
MNLRYVLEVNGKPAGEFAHQWEAERAIPYPCREAVIYTYDGPVLVNVVGLID